MRAVTWQGRGRMSVEDVPDPRIQERDDVVIRVTSSGLCGSDLHLCDPLAAFMEIGDVVGHEAIGVVEEVGADVVSLTRGDRVVVPFTISCGRCWMCTRGLQSQCEATQNAEQGTGASLFGYSKLYGQVPGAQAEYLRVPFGDFLPIKVPDGPPDDRFVFLSDVLPSAWQAIDYAALRPGETLLVLGAGPIGDMCVRIALMRGIRVLAVDPVGARLRRVSTYGAEIVDADNETDTIAGILERTCGRGVDAVIDAVGMEAHGSPVTESMLTLVGPFPDRLAQPVERTVGLDRLAALHLAVHAVRRGGTISVIGVYGGAMDPMPLMEMFDKQIQLRMGQANVRRWSDDILTLLLQPTDHLGVESFATHHLPLEAAPGAYRDFRDKNDGMVKVLFQP